MNLENTLRNNLIKICTLSIAAVVMVWVGGQFMGVLEEIKTASTTFASEQIETIKFQKELEAYELEKPNPVAQDPTNNKVCVYEVVEVEDFDKELSPEWLYAPSVNLVLPVKYVPIENGTWKVYDYVANFAQGTSLINGVTGNTGLFGHDRVHAFRPLKNLQNGDTVMVYSENFRVHYLVSGKQQVDPYNVDVLYPTTDPTLTLLTCDGDFSESRLATFANLTKIERITCYEKTN